MGLRSGKGLTLLMAVSGGFGDELYTFPQKLCTPGVGTDIAPPPLPKQPLKRFHPLTRASAS